MLVDVEQCKRVVTKYLDYTGRGGFKVGTVISTSPLTVQLGPKIQLTGDQLYVTDSCTELQVNGQVLRPGIKSGDGVLLICRPGSGDTTQYILLDRIQPYTPGREVTIRVNT